MGPSGADWVPKERADYGAVSLEQGKRMMRLAYEDVQRQGAFIDRLVRSFTTDNEASPHMIEIGRLDPFLAPNRFGPRTAHTINTIETSTGALRMHNRRRSDTRTCHIALLEFDQFADSISTAFKGPGWGSLETLPMYPKIDLNGPPPPAYEVLDIPFDDTALGRAMRKEFGLSPPQPDPAVKDTERLDALEKRGVVDISQFVRPNDMGYYTSGWSIRETVSEHFEHFTGATLRGAIDNMIKGRP